MQHLANTAAASARTAQIPSRQIELGGELSVPPDVMGIVLFAHGSGSSCHSPRNQFVARTIHAAGATLLFDLLTQTSGNEWNCE